MIKALALIVLLAGTACANSLQELDLYKSTAVYRVSGKIAVAASSSTYSTYTITLDGTAGISTTKPIATTSTMTAAYYLGLPITSTAAIVSSLNAVILSTGLISSQAAALASTQTFTGQNTFITTSTTTFGWIDIGVVYVSSHCVLETQCRVACPDGKTVLFSGCLNGVGSAYMYAVGGTTESTSGTVFGTLGWPAHSVSCSCAAANIYATAWCARIK